MKTNVTITKIVLATAALVVAGTAAAQSAEQPVRIKTEGMPIHLRERLEAKAQEGPTALIQYVNRTRMIHHLRVEDIVVPEETARVAAAQKALVATKADDEAKK